MLTIFYVNRSNQNLSYFNFVTYSTSSLIVLLKHRQEDMLRSHIKLSFLSLLLLPFFANCIENFNNVSCKNVYNESTKCNDDIDADLTTPQIIRRHGYESETYVIETDDGYLLTLHRIPKSKDGSIGKQPVLLQHGLLSSSADYVNTNNKSLAFILSDNGYDVWLNNVRGNTYSKAHVSIPVESSKYWNFSWHEMATKDLPAVVNFVVNKTGQPGEIIYIGHSMGTTMFFVFASELPSVAKNIKAMVALAPVTYMTHLRSPIRYLSPFAYDIEWLAKYLGVNQFLPNEKILDFLSYDCRLLGIHRSICEDIIFIICGFDKSQFDDNLLPVILSHIPAGTSTKTVIHYLQEIKNKGNFQKFDYGPQGNMIEYGNETAPSYNISNIKVPIYLMYAENDWLTSPIDVARLSYKLKTLIGKYEIPYAEFNHVDFLWAKDAPKLVYDQLLKTIKNYSIF